MRTQYSLTNETNALLVCQFFQAPVAESNIQSVFRKRPYLQYRFFANVEEPTQGVLQISFECLQIWYLIVS